MTLESLSKFSSQISERWKKYIMIVLSDGYNWKIEGFNGKFYS